MRIVMPLFVLLRFALPSKPTFDFNHEAQIT